MVSRVSQKKFELLTYQSSKDPRGKFWFQLQISWVTILIYSIAPPHWNLCELWPKNWQDKEKFHIFWPFFMNLTQFYPFFLKFDMILAYFSNITLKIWYWDFCKRVKGNWKDKDFWKKLSPMSFNCLPGGIFSQWNFKPLTTGTSGLPLQLLFPPDRWDK